jgi:hypothetical protein
LVPKALPCFSLCTIITSQLQLQIKSAEPIPNSRAFNPHHAGVDSTSPSITNPQYRRQPISLLSAAAARNATPCSPFSL